MNSLLHPEVRALASLEGLVVRSFDLCSGEGQNIEPSPSSLLHVINFHLARQLHDHWIAIAILALSTGGQADPVF
jgi:hypothetical protein